MVGAQINGGNATREGDRPVPVVFTLALSKTPKQEHPMGLREEGVTTCVTWSSVPPVVPVLIHLSAAIETAKGEPATGEELRQALSALHAVHPHGDADPEEYKAVASRFEVAGALSSEQTLPRDIIRRIVENLLDRKDSVSMLAGHKAGVPLRAWIPRELVARLQAFCKRRCSKSSFFVTAATLYFQERGIDIEKLT